jgi:hypothetical protein
VRRPQLIRVLPVIGLGLLAVAAVALTVRYVPIRNRMVLGIATLAPYLMLGAPRPGAVC